MKKTLLFLAAALTIGHAANAQTAFSEDFESVTVSGSPALGALPSGWTLYGDGLTNYSSGQSDYTAYGQSWSVYNMSGWGKLAFAITWTMEGSSSNHTPCDRWLITPAITVPETGNYSLKFDQLASDYDEYMSVLISTSGVEKEDFTDTLIDNAVQLGGDQTRIFNLAEYAGQTIHVAFIAQGVDALYLGIDNVEVAVIPNNSLAYYGATSASYAPMGNDFSVNVYTFNDGCQPLTSYDITYTLNGGEPQTVNVTGQSIEPYDYGMYTLHTSYPTAEPLTIAISVSNPNGETDVDDSDNSGNLSLIIYNPAEYTQRNTLLEHFSTQNCQYCPGGHERLEAAMEGIENRISWVTHHVGFGEDDMTVSTSNQIAALYGTNNTWAPAISIDRNNRYSTGNPGTATSVGSVESLQAIFGDALSIPAVATINLTNLDYNVRTRQLSVTVSGEFLHAFEGTNARLTLMVTEDGIKGRQASTSGYINDYVHNHVFRGAISDIWGDADAFTSTTAGSTYSKTYTFSIPTSWKANNCRLVAFIANHNSSNVNDRKVVNATQSSYLMTGDDPGVGIDEVETSLNVVAYPNPATEMAYISAESTIRSFEVVDAMGRKVMSQENVNADILELNVEGFSAGMYFISVTTDKGVATQRLSVVK